MPCFEVHLTFDVQPNQYTLFLNLCDVLGAKPLEIVLATGQYPKQLMISKTLQASHLDEVLNTAQCWISYFTKNNMALLRTKIEMPISERYAALYYEWHGRVVYEDVLELIALCKKYNVHLSKNALKQHTQTRFLTLRDIDKKEFEVRLKNFKDVLIQQKRELEKQQHEMCIYDDAIELDRGWA